MAGGMEVKLALVLAILGLLVYVAARIRTAGVDSANAKVLAKEAKAHAEFEERGEEWDAGTGSRADRERERLRELRKRKMRASIVLG